MPAKKKIKIIVDTNLFISFLIGKRLAGLKNTIVQSSVQLIFSEQNIEELRVVTQRPKFRKYFDNRDVADLIDLIHTVGKVVKISRVPEVCRDSKDNFLLALAEKGKADFLVTGDADLLIIDNYKNTRIITDVELEQLINKMNIPF